MTDSKLNQEITISAMTKVMAKLSKLNTGSLLNQLHSRSPSLLFVLNRLGVGC